MSTFGEAVTEHRKRLGWSQAELARKIPLDPGYLSKLLNGQKPLTREIAAQIDRTLGAGGDVTALAPADRPWMGATFVDDEPSLPDARVERDQHEWARTRRLLKSRHNPLAQLASRLYPPEARLGDTAALAGPGWIPDAPVDLADITLTHHPDAATPTLTGTEPESAGVRPRRSVVGLFAHYSEAVEALDRPKLFHNAHTWHLADVDWGDGKGRLGFGDSCYFAGNDVFQAVAHELAAVALDDDGNARPKPPVMRDLPFRRLIGDPFDLSRRPINAAISTLTIRRDPRGSAFLLHRRSSDKVAMAGGTLQVIPSGIFQPSSVLPAAMRADFDLWRNIQREFSEELLGNREHNGAHEPVDYTAEPFRSLDEARADGRLSVHCLGVGLDALTLFGEILTVLVMDSEVFDRFVPDFVGENPEGVVVPERIPFDEADVQAVLGSGRMAPAGAACLELAWRHRDMLIDQEVAP